MSAATTLMIPTLRTERLALRAPIQSDFEPFADFRVSERTAFLGGPRTRIEAFTEFCALVGHWQARGFGRWIVADGETDAPLGVVGLYFPEGWPEPEIAWSLFQGAEGKGIACEAALAARAYAYDVLGWDTAVSLTVAGNTRSDALARRLGARPDGTFTHALYGDMLVWRHPGPDAANIENLQSRRRA